MRFSMKTNMVAACVALAGFTTTLPAAAQDSTMRKVEQYTCKDVMIERGSSRDVAIAFLHGFLLGKSGSDEFDLDVLAKQTDTFIDHCLDNPTQKARDAMMKVKG